MLPNLLAMSLHADGGRMATKPYAAGGAYINRMSDYCRECDYNPKKRVGDDACPFTTLYWDFLDRNRSRLGGNQRMAMPLRNLDRMSDLQAVRTRAVRVLEQLDSGDLSPTTPNVDTVCRRWLLWRYAALCKQADKKAALEGAPHGCNVSDAETFNQALLDVLAK